jgi:hypothetical protein
MKKCPPGVICIENVTMFFIVICVLLVTYFVYSSLFNQKIFVNNKQTQKVVTRENGVLGYNIPKDVLLNPYYRDERYFIPELNYIPPGSVPINIQTNAVETTYRQVGILTPLNGNEKNNILPLMGRILFNRRDLWNYYTISNQHNNVKLPISVKGKSALTENGVDKVYNGDTVYVEGVNDAYKVTIYDNDTIRYLPFI